MVVAHALLLRRFSRLRPPRSLVAAIGDSSINWSRQCHVFRNGRALCSSPSTPSDPDAIVGADERPSLREHIASLGVFFTLPEQGVTSPEILARCSATPVRRTPSSPLRFVAAAHSVMPWAFPGYHDESRAWLKFLDESHMRYYAELRDPLTGTILTRYELINLAKHPSRDMAALGLKSGDEGGGEKSEERRVLDDIRSRGIPFSPLPLRRRRIGQSEGLEIVGYEVREPPGGLGQSEDPGMMIIRARGELAARTAMQAFVGTDRATFNPGMCGAAVLDADLELCGCVEGVVPTAPPEAEVEPHVRALQGMPCVVEWKDLDALLSATMDDAHDDDGRQARQEELPSSRKQER